MADNRERDAKICQLRRDGIGPREIAWKLSLSIGIVSGVLWRSGLTARDERHGATDEIRQRAISHAYEHGDREAADKYGVSRTTVGDWRRGAAA